MDELAEHTLEPLASPVNGNESPTLSSSTPPPSLAAILAKEHDWTLPPKPLSKQALEHKEPEKVAEYMVLSAEDPLATATSKARRAGLPEAAARALESRMRTRYAETLDEIAPITKEALEKRLSRRLDVIAGWLTDEKLEAKLEEAKLKDLGVFEGIALTKLAELRGAPTIIIRTEDSMKLDEIADKLLEEITRRKGGAIELSERKVTMHDGTV